MAENHVKNVVVVIGGGVIGLTTALRLKENGYNVVLLSYEFSPFTVSNKSAAIWYPFSMSVTPYSRAITWFRESFAAFLRVMRENPLSGVAMREGYDYFHAKMDDPSWKDAVSAFVPFERASESHLKDVNARTGEIWPPFLDAYHMAVPVIDMSLFMPYLMMKCASMGILMYRLQKPLNNLQELGDLQSIPLQPVIVPSSMNMTVTGKFELSYMDFTLLDVEIVNSVVAVVNCTGLGSGKLEDDNLIYPLRGQIVKVFAPSVTKFMFVTDEDPFLTYIIPLANGLVVCGGCVQARNWDVQEDKQLTAAIIKRCSALDPAIKDAPISSVTVGLRPFRAPVRLELDTTKTITITINSGRKQKKTDVKIIHNYGHGGNGVTVSFGCANEVLAILQSSLNNSIISTSSKL